MWSPFVKTDAPLSVLTHTDFEGIIIHLMDTRGKQIRRVFAAFLMLAALALMVCDDDPAPTNSPPRTVADIAWVSTCDVYADTLQKSHSIVFITASWCGWCTKLKNETLCNAGVQDELNDYFNPMLIEVTADSNVCYQDTTVMAADFPGFFAVSGYPTTFALDSNQQVISRLAGNQNSTDFLAWLKYVRSH